MNGHWIDIKAHDGGTFGAYVSTPPKDTAGGPGIVLIQEIWGVNQHIRDVADQYAMDGFTVFAPDVFCGSNRALISVTTRSTTPRRSRLWARLIGLMRSKI